jgi:cysteine desulfurase/selenocysteine lyase
MKDDLKKIRSDFPELTQKVRGKPLVYLDNAASTLKPLCVINTINRHYSSEAANIHRGVHYLSELGTIKYENTRQRVLEFINAKYSHEIIFTKGTTDALNLVAQSYGGEFLKPGDEILLSTMEHHANIVPWQVVAQKTGAIIRAIPISDSGELLMDEYKKLLSRRVKIVSLSMVSNSLGTINPIKQMIKLAHEVDAITVVDAAQAVSHMKIDVQKLNCDFLAFSSHKLFGPTGVGVLYGKEKYLEKMPPYQCGGDMIDRVSFEKTTYADLPFKFEAGTPHIAGGIALKSAIDYVLDIGFEKIQKYESELFQYANERLLEIEGLYHFGKSLNKVSIFSFNLADIHHQDVGTILDQQGIAVRTGHHCNQPLWQHYKVTGTVRASFSIYNTQDEVDGLINGIKKVKELF